MRFTSRMSTFALFFALACNETAGDLPGATRVETESSRPNVVLIVIDTLRADHLPTYGYMRPTAPVIDAFAQDSLVFDNALTVMGLTLPAHVSMMTGLDPRTHGTISNFVKFSGRDSTLAEILRADGYTTAAFVSGLPLSRRNGLGKGFEIYEDTRTAEGSDAPRIWGEKTTQRAIAWLREQEDSARPFFLFVHYYDTHSQYILPAGSQPPFAVDPELRERMEELDLSSLDMDNLLYAPVRQNGIKLDLAHAINAYDNQIRRVDGLVGKILSTLEVDQQLDNTLVIITSDHGEGLGQHSYYEHHLNLYEEQLRVPLIIRPPTASKTTPGRIRRVASLVDLTPSVLDWTGVPTETKFQGQSLRPGNHEQSDPEPRWLVACRPAFGVALRKARGERFSSPTPLCATRGDGPFKYLQHGDGREELYDLSDDPYETKNLAPTRRAELKQLRKRTKALMVPSRKPKAASKPVDVEQRKALEALGYIE